MENTKLIETNQGWYIICEEEIYYVGMISSIDWVIHRFEIVRSCIWINNRENAKHFFGFELD